MARTAVLCPALLFLYGLFKDAVSVWGYVAWHYDSRCH